MKMNEIEKKNQLKKKQTTIIRIKTKSNTKTK